jgi:hypothetical protein
MIYVSNLPFGYLYFFNIEHMFICNSFYEISGINSLGLVPIMQRAVMSANKRTTIRFQELNQKKYRTPLIVTYYYLLISYPISVSSAGLQWVQGKADEDRVYIVVSKEQGWVFVAIYDGFNNPDATDFLVPHP